MINFVDAGGFADDPGKAADNSDLLDDLISGVNIPTPGGIDYWAAGPHIYFPPGKYHFSRPIQVRKAVRLEGSSSATRAHYNTMFIFPPNIQGLILDNQDTDNLSYQAVKTTSAAGSRVEGICFMGSSDGPSSAHGILVRCFVVFRDVQVRLFGGHGIYVRASLASGFGGRASTSQFYDCGAHGNNASGLMIEGGDANAILVVGGDFSNNGDWGVCDLSFLGCTFTGIHTTQNAQQGAGYRDEEGASPGVGATGLVVYPSGSGQVWAVRLTNAAMGSTVEPGTNENVWTRYYGQLSAANTPPDWTSGIVIRPGGPYATVLDTAWSVWTGCYSESNQGPSQMGARAIVMGGDHGSGIQSVNTLTSGEPIWMDAHNGELSLKSNLRVKSLYLGQKPVRPTGSAGMKMSAAAAAPTTGAVYTAIPYMENSWAAGDIVWNQARTVTQPGSAPPLGWRCTGSSVFEEIPFPYSGSTPTFSTVTANQFIVPFQGSVSGTGGELHVRGNWVRITNAAGTQTYALFKGSSLQFPGLPTTASGANAFLDGGAYNALYRSTSSLRYKSDVQDLDGKYLDKLLDLRPVRYRSAAAADDPSLSHFGLIAEEVAGIEPRLVNFLYADEDYEEVTVEEDAGGGETMSRTERRLKEGAERKVPDGVQYDRLTVLLLGLAKRQQGEIDALKAQVAGLADSPASAGRGKRP